MCYEPRNTLPFAGRSAKVIAACMHALVAIKALPAEVHGGGKALNNLAHQGEYLPVPCTSNVYVLKARAGPVCG
jgi:hypothetical protein